MLGLSHSVEVALAGASVVMFVGTVLAVPVFFARVPDDYFARPRKAHSLVVRAVRIVIGVALIALGLAMIVLPGQGILTILVGLSVLDLPVKDRLIGRLLRQPRVRHAIDAMRHKAGKGSLIVPGASAEPATA
jgi:hypothetical protein